MVPKMWIHPLHRTHRYSLVYPSAFRMLYVGFLCGNNHLLWLTKTHKLHFHFTRKVLNKTQKSWIDHCQALGWVSNEGGYDSRPRKTPCLSQTFVNTSDSSTYWDVFDLSCDLGIPHSTSSSCHLLPFHFSILPLFVVCCRISYHTRPQRLPGICSPLRGERQRSVRDAAGEIAGAQSPEGNGEKTSGTSKWPINSWMIKID